MSEDDLLLLETYLDGELADEGEVQAVVRRLGDDAAFAAAFEQISSQRQVRQEAFRVMERDEVTASATSGTADWLARSLNQAAVREVVWASRLRILKTVSALAACLIVGLGVGWYVRGEDNPIPYREENPQVAPVSYESPGFKVAITDDTGRILAEQRFDTLNQAREFSNDIVRYQTRQRQTRNGEVRLIGGGF